MLKPINEVQEDLLIELSRQQREHMEAISEKIGQLPNDAWDNE